MLEILERGIYSDITIDELYYIIDIYSKSFKIEIEGHDNCLCKKLFNTNNLINNEKIDNMKEYLFNHYEKINKLDNIYKKFFNEFLNINWLINHHIKLIGKNNDFKINKRFEIIGYDENNVYIIYIKPQINELNYNEILVNSIFDSFLINNVKNYNKDEKIDDDKNYNDFIKFSNKNIITILFSFDLSEYFIIEWKNKNINLIDENNLLMTNLIKEKLIEKYIYESKNLYYYFIILKNRYNDLTQDKIIKNIINEIKNKIKNDEEITPHFIIKFFESIEYHIKFNKKDNILILYENIEYFNEKLSEIITESIDDFFNIKYDE
jgi:hypothetical protein